jgi:hypothetical protein
MGLLLPDSVVRDLRAERAREIEQAYRSDVCQEFTRELRKIDSYLEMCFWPHDHTPPGFVTGAYHIVRHNPGAPGSVEALIDKDGKPREPGSWVFDLIRSTDLWNPAVERDRKRFMKRALDAKERARKREEEEHKELLHDLANAAWRTQVSMTDVPWTQNASGRRGRST